MLFFSLLLLLGFENVMSPKLAYASEDRIIDERLECIVEGKEFNDLSALVFNADLNIESYAATKEDIGQLRNHLSESLKQGDISFDAVKAEFTNLIVDKIIPYWYGTPWSFEGHTALPNQGEIACGYFVSTTLRDMGLKLNRYKLAQKSPIDEARILSCGSDIHTVEQESTEKAFEEINRMATEGLYFIGFDTGHVGYLLKRNGQLFLIHSNYLLPRSVCIEPFEDSRVFKSFSKFHLVAISNNDVLIQHWLNDGTVL